MVGAIPPGATFFQWRVSGASAGYYPPPPGSSTLVPWQVGAIQPQPGLLTFTLNIQFAGGRLWNVSRIVEVGIRSDDVIVLGWINPNNVPNPASISVKQELKDALPPDDNVTDNQSCNLSIADLSFNIPLFHGANLLPAERTYMLDWMFRFGSSPDPRNTIPGSQFLDVNGVAADDAKVETFRAALTNFKLFNRFQVKMRITLDAATGAPTATPAFNGQPTLLHSVTPGIGTTRNPCGPIFSFLGFFPGQSGPANGSLRVAADTISLVNDGSPDDGAIRAFNTLLGSDDAPAGPVFWESIGSRISFNASDGPSGVEVFQPYPTYNVDVNGTYMNLLSRDQAVDPALQFQTQPYPFGTVVCVQTLAGTVYITHGGRCGDARSAPDATVRQPYPAFVIQ